MAALEAALPTPMPGYRRLRPTETGLAQLRARAGGTGAPFNLGEVTVTRAAVRLDGGATGFGWRLGRMTRAAELAALLDALLQDPVDGPGLARRVIDPIAEDIARRAEARARVTAATRVDFATLVRGE